MRFGFHISISGGASKIVERAKTRNCQAIQIFSSNPRGWAYLPLNKKELIKLKKELETLRIFPVSIHLPYLPNLASNNPVIRKKSLKTLNQTLKIAEILNASFVVTHVGTRGELSVEKAIETVAEGINRVFDENHSKSILLLENTSGQGRQIGYNFWQLKNIIDKIRNKNRIGVCLDTAHIFEAGYNVSTKKGLEDTLKEFNKYIGLKKLYLIHLNDSKTPLGSRVDRHWHIGKGYIGLKGFKNIINHPWLKNLAAIMETPAKTEKDDLKNMAMVRKLEK